ncbi:MAG: P1 family peptidase [Bacillota bacterium]|nr:P1 family peptidase [Bacillota bacterium]
MRTAAGEKRARLRDLGFDIGLLPTGKWNAITDVAGVSVGHCTVIRGKGELRPGHGPVRSGVTAIIQHDRPPWWTRVKAAIELLNGSGEIAGRVFVDEMGEMDSPILLTSSFNVPRVADATLSYMMAQVPELGRVAGYAHPVVAECSDMMLSDMQGRHIGEAEVWAALEGAATGPVAEGCVGGGTGLTCYQFKSGIGTASRVVEIGGDGASGGGGGRGNLYTVGVLVQANHGVRSQLRVDGVPVGLAITDNLPSWVKPVEGSIVMVVATDAPLSSRQVRRVTRRAALGLARTGSTAHNGSGDMLIGFSTGNLIDHRKEVHELRMLDNAMLNPLFDACAEAAEEAVINSITAATTMVGRDGNVAYAMPLDRLAEVLAAHGQRRRG